MFGARAWVATGLTSMLGVLVVGCSGPRTLLPGCGKDTDCRGGRICSAASQCIEPPAGSAARRADAAVIPVDAAVPVVGSPPFSMFGGDARNTGRLGAGAPASAPSRAWSLAVGDAIVGSPTLGPQGQIFFTSHDRKLYAATAKGALRWSFETGDRIWSTPAVAQDGTVYVGSDDDHLYAVDGMTGTEKWRFRVGQCAAPVGFGPEGSRCDVDGGPTIGPDGTIYVGGDGVYAIWPNGALRWKFATPEHVSTTPALSDDGTVYVGCLDDALYAIAPDGTKAWEMRTHKDIESSPAVADDGTIYFGGDDGIVYAVSRDGQEKWKVITAGPVRGSPAIAPDGTIYVGSYDRNLYAISPRGAVVWRFTAADKIHASPAVAADGTVLVGSQDDHLYALSPDGQLRWYLTFGADVDTIPTITADGMLLVGSDDKTLSAFR